jgi:serine/threonine protein kinase
LIGETLAHYRITGAIGAGGMGEVYRATDTKLGREVAIKVLPPEVARDAERLGRFEREAHLLASLNHPGIAAIHGIEEADGQPFLVLELVEGEDLKQRLSGGPFPWTRRSRSRGRSPRPSRRRTRRASSTATSSPPT